MKQPQAGESTSVMRRAKVFLVVLVFVSSARAESESSAWKASPFLRLFGRMHAMVVHFPIALIVTAAVCDAGWCVLRRRKAPAGSNSNEKSPEGAALPPAAVNSAASGGGGTEPRLSQAKPGSSAAGTCLIFGALGAIVSAWFGWLNADFEHAGSTESLLTWHRWLGVVTAGVAGVCMISRVAWRRGAANAGRVYGLGMAFGVVLVAITGHLGGSLVYGNDYLTEVFRKQPSAATGRVDTGALGGADAEVSESPGQPVTRASEQSASERVSAPAAATTQAAGKVSFATEIQAIFTARCVECHGPEVTKGGLRLDTLDRALESDAIRPGDAEGSELIERITLSADHRRFMPKKREPLTAEEIEAIRRWIAGLGASEATGAAGSAKRGAAGGAVDSPPDKIGAVAPLDVAGEATSEVAIAARNAALARLRERRANAQPIAADSPEIEVDFSLLGRSAGDAELELLSGLGSSLRRLNLSGTSVGDVGLSKLGGFPELRRVNVSRTGVTDAGIEHLSALSKLEWLNCFETGVTDAGVSKLVDAVAALRRVYVGRSGATDKGMASLRQRYPALRIELDAPLPASEPSGSVVAEKQPACCERARAARRECDHQCCVEARAAGKVCATCAAG